MKLATFQLPDKRIHIGVVREDHRIVDLTAASAEPAFASMLALIEAGPGALDEARVQVSAGRHIHDLAGVQLLAPIPRPPRLRDFLTFEQHVRQSRANRYLFGLAKERVDPASIEIPPVWYERPIYYKCNHFSVVGHGATVRWPSYSKVIDYELEIGAVIGRSGVNLSPEQAAQAVFGYTIYNDFSARDAQFAEMAGQLGPSKGKDFDTGNALGPWIVTADEIPDPQQLRMYARVNGELWSTGVSSGMQHSFAKIVAYASLEEPIVAGEVMGSGTVGNGCGSELGKFLKHGDVIELEIVGIGVLRNTIEAPHVPAPPAFPIRIG